MNGSLSRVLAAGIALVSAVAAQPYINGRSVRNSASFMPPSLGGGAIAQGSIFSLFGRGLGPATSAAPSKFPLQATLSGVSVAIIQGNVRIAALPIYVSSTQINAIMPSQAPLGRVAVEVTYNGQPSNPSPVTVVTSAFGIYGVNSAGVGPGVIMNFVSSSQQPVNSLKTSAAQGQIVTMWGTGLGPVPADNVAPSAGNLQSTAEVFVGGISAIVTYHGRSPCCAGIDQLVFTVPANAPTGCYVPVVVRTGGSVVSNAITMSIAARGSSCSDAFNALEQPLIAGESVGFLSPHRVDAKVDVIVSQGGDVSTDFLAAALLAPNPSAFSFSSLISLPPQGTCTTYTADGDLLQGGAFPILLGAGKLLDGGIPSVAGVSLTALPAGAPLFYDSLLGGSDSNVFSNGLEFSPPAAISLSLPGGADVGAASVSVPTDASIVWTNRDSLDSLARSDSLAVKWTLSGPSGSSVIVGGANYDSPNNATAMFLCVVSASANSFAVPTWALANLPATRSIETQPNGWVFVGVAPLDSPATFTAKGLDAGFALYSSWFLKSVIWR